MNQEIKSIREAYSIKAKWLTVGEMFRKDIDDIIAKIIPNEVHPIMKYDRRMYVGYNENGDVLFEYMQDSVNVHYK